MLVYKIKKQIDPINKVESFYFELYDDQTSVKRVDPFDKVKEKPKVEIKETKLAKSETRKTFNEIVTLINLINSYPFKTLDFTKVEVK